MQQIGVTASNALVSSPSFAGSATGSAGMGQEPPASSLLGPGQLQFEGPPELQFEPGQMVEGQVVGTGDAGVTLMFGDTQVTASTNGMFVPGQFVSLQVDGQVQGKWLMGVAGTHHEAPISEQDVTDSLMALDVQPTEGNVEVAKALLSMGLPLSEANIGELAQALAQLSREASPSDATAAAFLKASSLPLTGSNLGSLSSFLAMQPFIGLQLMNLETSLRRLLNGNDTRSSMSERLVELLEETPSKLGLLALAPRQQSAQALARQMADAAYQQGSGAMGPFVSDDSDLSAWLAAVRERLNSELPGHAASTMSLLSEMQQNLQAIRLLNNGAAAQGSQYLQLPLRPSNETAEARLIYHVETGGYGAAGEEIVIELLVPTTSMGTVSWRIAVCDRRVSLDVALETDAACEAVKSSLVLLTSRLEALGFEVDAPVWRRRASSEQPRLTPIRTTVFESLERIDIQA